MGNQQDYAFESAMAAIRERMAEMESTYRDWSDLEAATDDSEFE